MRATRNVLGLLTVVLLLVVGLPQAVLGESATADPGVTTAGQASEDGPAGVYYRLLLKHTRWMETQWDEAAGRYSATSFAFAGVLGNAVLLKFGSYDAELAGVSRETLLDHTVRTIRHYAASNRHAGGQQWGRVIFWDSTYEAYFAAAAKLLWDQLDEQTRSNVDAIVAGSAEHVRVEGPQSAGGLAGGHRGDSKIEEMGAKSMPLAAALAYAPDHPSAGDWATWLTRWTTNMTGLPVADRNNQALIDGRPVSEWNQAHNIYDTFAVENHGTLAPHYQASAWVYPGRDAVQFLIAGRPIPKALRRGPNADELWDTSINLATAAGVPAHPMIGDRHHLYGRDALPLAARHILNGDATAARAEAMLLSYLPAYQDHEPANRLTKFSGEPHYEPEARAEIAIAYLLHIWRDRVGEPVTALTEAGFYRAGAGAVDYGDEVGLVAHQTPAALALAVTKPGYVKFGYLPEHDDWLLRVTDRQPSFLPSTSLTVRSRRVHEYRAARDGVDATATLLDTDKGTAGFTTLPDGSMVYATSGLGPEDGVLGVENLAMPGVRGLDGDRDFHTAAGLLKLRAVGANGDGGRDEVRFPATGARHVRMQGIAAGTQFGYSIYGLAVHGDGADLAAGRPTTASSFFGVGFEPRRATDGDPATRWAVSRDERTRGDAWLAVDLGAERTVDRVVIDWQARDAFASAYRIQVSADGSSWETVATVPETHDIASSWVNIDERAGFVVRGGGNPIRLSPERVVLSAGTAQGSSGMVVEGYAGQPAATTAALAAAPAPASDTPGVSASLAGGHLSLFNLTAADAGATITLPRDGDDRMLFRGRQELGPDTHTYSAAVDALDARVEPARFTLRAADGTEPRLTVDVADSDKITLTSHDRARATVVEVRSLATGERRTVAVPPGGSKSARLGSARVTPTADLARARRTFPTSPLPAGMSSPAGAVDGDKATAWVPGGTRRMVVDLGAARSLGSVELWWRPGAAPPYKVLTSSDGVAWSSVAEHGRGRPHAVHAVAVEARYVAVEVTEPGPVGRPSWSGLAELSVWDQAPS
jgi:F5/8 type C domain